MKKVYFRHYGYWTLSPTIKKFGVSSRYKLVQRFQVFKEYFWVHIW